MSKIIATCAFLALLTVSTSSQALIITHPDQFFVPGQPTEMKLGNFESAFDTGTNNNDDDITDPDTWVESTTIATGSALRGIFRITSSEPVGGGTLRSPDGFELTGIFSGIVEIVAFSGTDALFELTPDPVFEAEYGTGAMAALFHDTDEDYTGVGTFAESVATAVGGDLYIVLGATGDWGDEDADGDGYYWASNGSTVPSVSSFAASLALLENNTGFADWNFLGLTQPPPISGDLGSFTNEAELVNIVNPFALQGNTDPVTAGGISWDIDSEDPLRAHTIPEPASLAVWSLLSLIGLAVVRRRRRS